MEEQYYEARTTLGRNARNDRDTARVIPATRRLASTRRVVDIGVSLPRERPHARGGWLGHVGASCAAGGLENAIEVPPKGTKAQEQSRAANADNQNTVQVEDELI